MKSSLNSGLFVTDDEVATDPPMGLSDDVEMSLPAGRKYSALLKTSTLVDLSPLPLGPPIRRVARKAELREDEADEEGRRSTLEENLPRKKRSGGSTTARGRAAVAAAGDGWTPAAAEGMVPPPMLPQLWMSDAVD